MEIGGWRDYRTLAVPASQDVATRLERSHIAGGPE